MRTQGVLKGHSRGRRSVRGGAGLEQPRLDALEAEARGQRNVELNAADAVLVVRQRHDPPHLSCVRACVRARACVRVRVCVRSHACVEGAIGG